MTDTRRTAPSAADPPKRPSVRKRLLTGSSWVLFGRAVSIVLGVTINAFLARMLSPPEFGAYLTAFTLVIVGAVIAQLGLDRAVVRLVASSIGVEQPGRARAAIRRILWIGTIAAVVVGAVLAAGVGPWLANNVYHSKILLAVIPVTGGWLIATAIQSLFVETFRGLQNFGRATLYDALLVDVLTATTLAALFVFGTRHLTAGEAVGISAGMTTLVAAVAGVLLWREVRGVRGDGHLNRGEIYAIAWPSLITNIAIYLLGSGIDLLVLGVVATQSQVALYGAATRLVTLVATPLWILRGVMPPIVAELHEQGKREELEETLRVGATLAGLPSLMILLVFVAFGKPVLHTLYGSAFYEQAVWVLVILSVGRLVAVWAGAAGITLMMSGHQKSMMYITVVTGACSVAFGFALGFRYGKVGVAVATATFAVIQNGLQVMRAKQLVGVWTFVQLDPRKLKRYFFRGGFRTFLDARRERSAAKGDGSSDGSDAG